MKRLFIIIELAMAFAFPTFAAAATIFTEGFESGNLSSWVVTGSNWVIDPTDGHLSGYSVRVQGTATGEPVWIEKTISTAGYTNIGINFWYKAFSGLTNEPEPTDEVFLEWSGDNGLSWTLLKTIDETAADGQWNWNLPMHPINLPASANNNPNFKIRFGAVLKDISDIVNVDDIEITGTPIDTDGDSIPDSTDNCVTVPNFDQADADTNGVGDACDNVPENTLLLCTDKIDNDRDGLVDIADEDCVAFRPTIYVTKQLNNGSNGPLGLADFTYQWVVGAFSNMFTMPSGTRALTYPFTGNFSVTEDPVDGYSTTYEGCVGVLGINMNAYCTITNTWNGGGGNGGGATGGGGGASPMACSDGSDNDGDGKADFPNDPGCSSPNDTDETDVSPTPTTGGEQGGGANTESTGEVLGAATTEEDVPLPAGCSPYLHGYLKYGKKNDPEEVKKLQKFLNEQMGTNIPVTGFFGSMTRSAVKKFQKRYYNEIIQPWIDAGFDSADLREGTGFVYKTTIRWINIMKCEALKNDPMPELAPYVSSDN
jgi:hypothetical protein